jgi:hypothetical protein
VKKFLTGLKVFVIGFISFWLPSFVGHAISGKNEFSHPVFFLIFICPFFTAFLTLFWIRKKSGVIPKTLVSFLFLIGIWILGLVATLANGCFGGSGFTSMSDWQDFFILMLCWPITTFSMATYDGTLGALLAFSLVVIIQLFIDLVFYFKKKNSE